MKRHWKDKTEDSRSPWFTYDRQVGHGRDSFGLGLNLARIVQSNVLYFQHVFLPVHMSENRSARVDLHVVLVPGDGDVLMRQLQLKPSSFAFLYGLVLYRRDKFEPDTYECVSKAYSYQTDDGSACCVQ